MIRGKGSVKEGKVIRKDGQPLPGEDEPLHALVSSTNVENVMKAVNQIKEIIKTVSFIISSLTETGHFASQLLTNSHGFLIISLTLIKNN